MTITPGNLNSIYGNFVLSNIPLQKLDEHELIHFFINIIFDECKNIDENRIVIVIPDKNGQEKGKIIKINRIKYNEFKSAIKFIDKPKSKDEIISQFDILINDVFRRFRGEFFTPKIWVDEAHNMISQEYGSNWKEEYVVWDPASGPLNLTKDYYFNELYCSTLFQTDLDIANQRGYNPEAVKFQYDFLNDDVYPEGLIGVDQIEDKLERSAPELVKSLRENKKIIIFMNPSFAGPGSNARDGSHKATSGKNKINIEMLSKKLGYCSSITYVQFIFRILLLKEKYKLNNLNLCSFFPSIMFSGSSFNDFRDLFLNSFYFSSGLIFPASEFSNVAQNWGISFSIFKSGVSKDKNLFLLQVKDKPNNNLFEKTIYNLKEKDTATNWARDIVKVKDYKSIECVPLTSPLKINLKLNISKLNPNSIGYLNNSSNNVSESSQYTAIFSSSASLGFPIVKENFYESICLFTARSLIEKNWVNWTDEFIRPQIIDKNLEIWKINSIIISLFGNGGLQSSLRNITYKNKQWNIFNEFFWLSNQYMQDLANQHNFNELYQDAKTFNKDRFVYNELQKVLPQLSPDAIAVLNKANELVEKSFIERKNLFYIHPEWHLEAWDAGWYQIKLVLKEKFPDDLKEFRLLYREFENRIREGVYKFGFLK